MPSLTLKPMHKAATAVRSAFQELIEHRVRQFDWKGVGKKKNKCGRTEFNCDP
jgi:hypothetical protein